MEVELAKGRRRREKVDIRGMEPRDKVVLERTGTQLGRNAGVKG